MSEKLRFAFKDGTDRAAVEEDLALAIFAAECVFGKARVRMEASYAVADDGRACLIDVGGEAGEAAARVFTGLATVRIGEDAFSVKRLNLTAVTTPGIERP
jgi:hypothetical protein